MFSCSALRTGIVLKFLLFRRGETICVSEEVPVARGGGRLDEIPQKSTGRRAEVCRSYLYKLLALQSPPDPLPPD
jgi:hypothetical protein